MSDWYNLFPSKLQKRTWADISDKWTTYFPLTENCFLPPEQSFDGNYEVRKHLEDAIHCSYVDDLHALKQSVFLDSLFLCSKGYHVLANAQLGVTSGYCTWSVSTAYHASFFFAKALLGLLGVAFYEKGRFLCLDIWNASLLDKKELKKHSASPTSIFVFHAKARNAEHVGVWTVLKKLFALTKLNDHFDNFSMQLSEFSADDIVRARNDIHYKTEEWIFLDELWAPIDRPHFGRVRSVNLSADDKDFTLFFAFRLAHFVGEMLGSLPEPIARNYQDFCVMKLRECRYHEMFLSATDQWDNASRN